MKFPVHEFFDRFEDSNTDPKTELVYHTPFELLIAVILSARATDKSVNKATEKLYPIANTPEGFLALGQEKLESFVKTIGLYKTKTKHILETCRILLAKHAAEVPDNREALEALPGVGRKTANVLLNALFNQPTIAVDTHIFRVSNRTELAPGKTVTAVEKELMQVVPPEYQLKAHHWLVLHGRYICKAHKPLCGQCIVKDLCRFPEKNL
jgi:endonuclease-3